MRREEPGRTSSGAFLASRCTLQKALMRKLAPVRPGRGSGAGSVTAEGLDRDSSVAELFIIATNPALQKVALQRFPLITAAASLPACMDIP